MERQNKTYHLPKTLVHEIDKYSNDSGINKSRIVEFAIREYLEKRNVYPRA